MDKDLTYYRAIQNSIGCQSKTDWIRQNTIQNLERSFENPLDVETFVFWTFSEGLNEEIRLEVVDEKYSAANGDIVKVTSLLDFPVKIGDVLYRPDQNEYYICCESFKKSRMFYKCSLVRCNYWMKWQNKDTKKIYEYPVFDINSTQYNSGESGDKTITLGSSQHLITVTADENTMALDHNIRMFWDRDTGSHTVFKITQNDTTAMNYDKGICKVTITEDQYNPDTDSIENWLCDYKEAPPESDTSVTITYTGNPTIRVGGTKTLRVETDSQVDWSVEGDLGITLTPNNNSVTVRCPNDYNLVDKSFVVKAKVDGVVGSLELTITGGV